MERVDDFFGIPRWAWLPTVVGLLDLAVAAFGYYWDVTWHIEKGRDEQIFTLPHTMIIVGLLGVGACGLLAHRLYTKAGAPSGIRILRWTTAPGAALLVVCGGFAALGFPLDDVWHRLFGQDVTAWGPTHLLMISGAALSPLAFGMLLAQGRRHIEGEFSVGFKALAFGVGGAMLVGLSAYQAEFDFGVPQFQLLFHPLLIAIASGLVLVATRHLLGRWSALGVAINYIVIRGLVDIGLIIAGRGPARFPSYLFTAVVVEATAHLFAKRPFANAVATGIGIGTIGLFGESLILQLWNYHPWPLRMMLPAILLGSVAAIAASLLGRAIAAWMRPDVPTIGKAPVFAALAVLVIAMAIPLPRTVGAPIQTEMRLIPADAVAAASPEQVEQVQVFMTVEPADAVNDADWFEIMAWQGGDQVIAPLEATDGGYETATSVPIGGEWKTLVRMAKGSQVVATPIYLPADPEVGAHGFAPRPNMSATLELDSKLLLREAKGGPTWAIFAGYGTVISVAVIWIGLIFWGLIRLRSSSDRLLQTA
ncbi:MAG TPA: hypothetical protein VE174_12620 [Actinomycetota bacterium]|nr:hypothetical protein [Actinomycetota bacterium]